MDFNVEFSFFSYLIDWFGFSGATETTNIGSMPVQGNS